MKLHVITGFAKCGSTLLCNILNQNPIFHASDTSHIPLTLNVLNNIHSRSVLVKNKANYEPEKTQERISKMFKGVVDNWYHGKKVVFDKSREWCFHARTLTRIYPDAKIICVIRDPRNVFSSIIKNDDDFPLITNEQDPSHSTIRSHLTRHFEGGNGIIGRYINGVQDLVDRKLENVLIIKGEDLTTTPRATLKKIYDFIGEKYYEHDFNNVINVSKEPDGFWNGKFIHKGDGKVFPCNVNEWKSIIPEEIAEIIVDSCEMFYKKFGYAVEKKKKSKEVNEEKVKKVINKKPVEKINLTPTKTSQEIDMKKLGNNLATAINNVFSDIPKEEKEVEDGGTK